MSETFEPNYVCSNAECSPMARRRALDTHDEKLMDRSYYWCGPWALTLMEKGEHPGCLRCGAKLVPMLTLRDVRRGLRNNQEPRSPSYER
jgi:hypothetical protein